MAYKTARLLINGPNKTWVEILVRFMDNATGVSMTWDRIGVIKPTGSFSGDYDTKNYPSFISFKDTKLSINLFTLSGFQNDPETRFPFNEKSKGEGVCLASGFEVHQGSLTWKVIEIKSAD